MATICPHCEKETRFERSVLSDDVVVRGETFTIEREVDRCSECGDIIETTRSMDEMDIAYREYRKCHGFLQPEEIKSWRKSHGLTQKELADLFNWGLATISRYENGALQSKDHEKFFRLAMEPGILLKLINDTPEAITQKKKENLIEELKLAKKISHPLESIFEEWFGHYGPNVLSGYKKLDISKTYSSIIFLCKGGQLKTKLNKLLFYADFKHFKETTISITGLQYVHLPLGPVPDNYEFYFANLIRNNWIEISEVDCHGLIGEQFDSQVEPDFSEFETSEIRVLAEIKEIFKNYNSTQIKNYSHEEEGFLKTSKGEFISYIYSSGLRI